MKRSRLITALSGCLFFLISSISGATVFVDKQPTGTIGWNSNVGVDWERSADDFSLTGAATVKTVSWYGWFDDENISTGDFDILFFEDIGMPSNPAFFSTTLTNVTGVDTGMTVTIGAPFDKTYHIFKWTASIPPANFPSGGNYWISVQAHTADPNDFDRRWIWTSGDPIAGESGVAFQDQGETDWSESTAEALAFTLESAEDAIDLTGTIKTADGSDICAMVLASGRYMFSCNPPGVFSLLDLPRENDGTVKRQIYADGFFPKIDILPGSTDEAVVMMRSGTCPSYNTPYVPGFVPGSAGKRINISGKVLLQNNQTSICAMVLANGQYMFSCDGTGSYALNIPLDTNGQFKLQVYADGFAPTIQTFDEFQPDNDVRMARAVECQ